ncbi:MAG: hypothetical protein AAFN70_03800 [Planctomycetota bacterium]
MKLPTLVAAAAIVTLIGCGSSTQHPAKMLAGTWVSKDNQNDSTDAGTNVVVTSNVSLQLHGSSNSFVKEGTYKVLIRRADGGTLDCEFEIGANGKWEYDVNSNTLTLNQARHYCDPINADANHG